MHYEYYDDYKIPIAVQDSPGESVVCAVANTTNLLVEQEKRVHLMPCEEKQIQGE